MLLQPVDFMKRQAVAWQAGLAGCLSCMFLERHNKRYPHADNKVGEEAKGPKEATVSTAIVTQVRLNIYQGLSLGLLGESWTTARGGGQVKVVCFKAHADRRPDGHSLTR